MGARLLTAGYSTIYLIEFLEETYGDRAQRSEYGHRLGRL